MPMDFVITVNDHSNEKTRTNYKMATVTDGATLTAYQASQAAMQGAHMALVAGNLKSTKPSFETNLVSNAIPASKDAQRERKIVVKYEDVVTAKQYSLEIGCANTDVLTIPEGSDIITLADGGAMAAYKTAFEANVISPVGNAVSVIQAVLVGRNL